MRKFVNISDVKKKIPKILGESVVSIKSLDGGLVNQNLIATTKTGLKYTIKVYRVDMSQEKILMIENVLIHLEEQGVPVPRIFANYKIKSHQVVIYPFIEGKSLPRRGLNLDQVFLLGQVLGKIHAALDGVKWPIPRPKYALTHTNKHKFIDELDRLAKISKSKKRQYSAPALEVIDDLRECVLKHEWRIKPTPLSLRPKLGHDDFHSDNLLVNKNKVVGILDWEKMGWTMRGFEIMRSIVFCCRNDDWLLDWTKVKIFIKGYKQYSKVTELEAKFAFETCLQKMVFSAWAVNEYLSGHVEMINNANRRLIFIKDALAHREQYGKRIEKLLR